MENKKIQIYYDGECHLCSREISVYERYGKGLFEFVDIADPEFDPENEGLDAKHVQDYLHVRKADGSVVTGFDGFIAIWETIPRYRMLSKMAKQKAIRFFLDPAYRLFALKLRPLLSKRRQACLLSR